MLNRFSAVTLLARLENLALGWAGLVRCEFQTSLGRIVVIGNRESALLTMTRGEWAELSLLRLSKKHRATSGVGDQAAYRAMSVRIVKPETTTAWLPSIPSHRVEHMKRLLMLLEQLEPSLQAAFMIVMRDLQIQERFFRRVASADHHCYPGGLFDQSVVAGEVAFLLPHDSRRERDLAALAALLFDLGKTLDDRLGFDRHRMIGSCVPHFSTARLLVRAVDALNRFDPEIASSLASLLNSRSGMLPIRVQEAVKSSWSIHLHQL